MKHLRKTSLALLTVCVLILCTVLCAANISAVEITASGECGDNLNWTLYDNGALTVTGEGPMWNWDPYDPAPWADHCESILSVSISMGITEIGDFAFAQCSALTNISFPDGVCSIGECAFAYCDNLSTVSLPLSTKIIYGNAFMGCTSLPKIKLPGNLESIYDNAFENCTALTTVTLPASLTFLDSSAFSGCTSLTFIGADKGSADFASIEGVLHNREMDELLIFPAGKTVETYVVDGGITKIGDRAFNSCTIDNLIIPASVTEIYPFRNFACKNITVNEANPNYASLEGALYSKDKSLLISYPSARENSVYSTPSTVTAIGNDAFSGNTHLREVILGGNVSSIGFNAFLGCDNLQSLTVYSPNTTFAFGNFFDNEGFVLYGRAGSTAETHAADHGIRFEVINDKPIAKVVDTGTCGDSITWTLYEDGTLVFDGTGAMWDYESGEELPYADYVEDITSAVFNPGITHIGTRALVRYYYITSISIPDTVTKIGSGAFFGCENLTSIVFPNSITEIENAVLANCLSLESVVLSENLTSIPDNTFQNNFTLKSVAVPDSVTSLGMAAFGWCYGLESISLPKNLTEIGPGAFIECTALETVSIPNSVTTIGDIAFQDCSNLKAVTLPDHLASIPYGLFYNCYTLESVSIPEAVTLIEPYAFSSCQSIQSLCIPAAVTEIGEGAFAYCSGLTIEIAEGQEHYIRDENGALFTADMTRLLFFPHQSDLETYAIPEGVLRIDSAAFHDDCSLQSVSIPASVTEIGENTFGAAHFITAYSVDENNPAFSTDEHGVLFNKNKTELIQYPIGRENGSYTVPDSVINILSEAFAYSLTLTDLTMGANVETIGTGAFQCCENLNNFTLPESLKSADAYAFSECYALTSMTLPENMEYLGDYAFGNSYNLTEVNVLSPNMEYAWDVFASIPAESFTLYGKADSTTQEYAEVNGLCFEITQIAETETPVVPEPPVVPVPPEFPDIVIPDVGGNGSGSINNITWVLTNGDLVISGNGILPYRAFAYNPGILTVTIEEGITEIGYEVFDNCSNLKSVSIGNGVASIGGWAFNQCEKLESIHIPDSVTTIGSSAFNGCSALTSVNLPASLVSIDEWAFNLCSGLTEVVIPEGVRTIGESAFYQCTNLTSVTIPASVSSIGSNAFGTMSFANKITAFVVDENNPWYSVDEAGVLYNKDKTVLVAYPAGKTETSFTVPDTVTAIGAEAFSCNRTLTEIILPDGLVSIEPEAFAGCLRLKGIRLPDSIVTIGATAFEKTAITNVVIPDGVASIGHSAFAYCHKLTDATVLGSDILFGIDVFDHSPNVTVSGLTGSTAEAYAAENNLPFASIGELPALTPGDISGDGAVDITDSIALFQHSMLPTIYPIDYNGTIDLNKDGSVDILDAVVLFQHSMLPTIYPIDSEGVYADFFKSVAISLDFIGISHGFNSTRDLHASQLIDIAYGYAEQYDVDFTPYREYTNDWMYVDSIPVDVFNTLSERMWGVVPAYESYSSNPNEFFGYDKENEIFRYSNAGGRSYDQTFYFDSYTVKNGKFTVKIKTYKIVYTKPETGVEGEDWFHKFIWDEDAYFVFSGWQWLNATLADGYIRIDSCTMP